MAGPILRISCDKEVEFQEPVTLQLPLSLREKPDIPDSSLVRPRVLFQQSDDQNREWTEITDSLESPPSFDETVISFRVRHFSGYARAETHKLKFFCFYGASFSLVEWYKVAYAPYFIEYWASRSYFTESYSLLFETSNYTTRDSILEVLGFRGLRIE